MVKYLSQKQLIIDLISLKKMVFFVKKYSVLQKIGSAIVVNIREFAIEVLYAIVAALRLRANLSEERELAI